MKKFILILMCAVFAISAAAQNKATVKLALVDTITREPAAYAAVMLYPEGDTTALYYALAGLDGKAKFERVNYGKYTLKAELMGYEDIVRPLTVEKSNINLGTIAFKEDFEMLQGATISAVGSAITIKQDTIEYTATSFKVKDNAVLIDLLKKLPGIEVGSDGSITAQGETIKKITLNGKTFFLDDPSLATENIPVSVIEKVKVIDKKSEQAQFTGIEDDDTEKIIDVSTYKGMFDGWFGNLSGGAGSDWRTLTNDSQFDLTNDVRYQANGIIGRFNETDQLAFVGNGNNTNNRMGFGGPGGGGGGWGGNRGINNEWMAGVNYGTTRVKDLEANVSAEYSKRKSDVQSKDRKTTYVNEGDDMLTNSSSKSFSNTDMIEAGAELRYTPERSRIIFRPRFNYEYGIKNSSKNSETGTDLIPDLNTSDSYSFGITDSKTADGFFMVGQRIGQRAGRTISLRGRYSFSDSQTDAKEFSDTRYAAKEDNKIDQYSHTDSKSMSLNGNLEYTEPITDYWFLTTEYAVNYSHSNSVKDTYDYYDMSRHTMENTSFVNTIDDADDYNIKNDYYSSSVDNTFITQRIGVNMNLQRDKNYLQFGASLQPTYNETHTTKFGVSSVVGEGEWLLNWSPEIRARYTFSPTTNIRGFYNGRSSQPSTSKMQPILDVSNPTAISTGNAYLLPSFTHNATVRFATNNKYTFSSLNVDMRFNYGLNSVVTASWYDRDGVSYSIPVNSKKPSTNISTNVIYNTPIARSVFSIASFTRASFTKAVSYQNTVEREGLNAETFVYEDFMQEFWGSQAGEKFYTGQSGFAESNTTSYGVVEDLSLRYNGDKLYASIGGNVRYNNALYSLNSTADKHTLDNSISGSFIWTLFNVLELSSDARYTFYRGYTTGYNDPEFVWNAGVSCKMGSFSLAANVYDLLEQSKSISRTTNENYLLDSWSNRLGRYFIFKLTYTFGTFKGPQGGRGGFGGGGFGGGRGGFGGGGGRGRF